jgi:AraC-like DNA-binding protein
MAQPRAFLAGPLTHPWTLRGGRRIRTLGIRFRPGATTRFLRVVMGRASDREVPLGRLVGAAEERALLTSLRRARGRVGRATAAERWLLLRMRELAPRADDARRAVDVILRSHGRATMERVARSIGWSTRRIERAFERDVGLRPKLFARIVRLNAVLATLDDAERRRVVDLALDAGYFDQAHLLRDFRALAGRPPRAGRETDGEMARNFTRPGRLRALLSGD